MNNHCDLALDLAARGLAVLPLHAPVFRGDKVRCSCGAVTCQSVGKHPNGSLATHGLKDATRDETKIRRWFKLWPNANLGFTTGAVVAIDIDPRHAGDETLRKLEQMNGALPRTWRAITGSGGEHILFSAPASQPVANSAGKIGPGIDVRGVGGYVVAPGSVHACGRRYEWSCDHHPDDMPLAQMPEWLIAATGAQAVRKAAPPSEWRTLVRDGVGEGGRNNAVARLVGMLLRKNVDAEIVFELAIAWNRDRCRPPLSDEEVEAVTASIAAKEIARREAAYGRA